MSPLQPDEVTIMADVMILLSSDNEKPGRRKRRIIYFQLPVNVARLA